MRRASSCRSISRRGNRILFGKWSGTEAKIDGEELLIMKESDILGVVEGKQPMSGLPKLFSRTSIPWQPCVNLLSGVSRYKDR